MKNVVVVGANGFIGSHLTCRLAEEGKQTLALVLKGTEYDFLKNIDGVTCREFSFDDLLEIRIEGYDTIFNMAWAGVSSTVKNEALTQVQNIIFGLKVLEFAEQNNIKRIVVPGSASEVSCGNGVITGKETPAPSDMYSASKVAARYVCMTYARQHNLDLIWTLITSVYGPGRDDNNLISYTVKTLLKREEPSFTGLEQQWDYIYIDDLITALFSLGEKGVGGKVYPVGSGEHRQMREYVYQIRDKIDYSLQLGIGDLPYKNPNKIDNQILDISELTNDTGFNPHYNFGIGIDNVIDYYSQIQNK